MCSGTSGRAVLTVPAGLTGAMTHLAFKFVQGPTLADAQHAKKKPRNLEVRGFDWWASSESNRAPTDYESAALTRHELEARWSQAICL